MPHHAERDGYVVVTLRVTNPLITRFPYKIPLPISASGTYSFVHPAEFLVTAPDGSIASRTILGNQLLVSSKEIGTEADSNRVFYFDLPRE